MSVPKDPPIKLFGKTIQSPEIQGPPFLPPQLPPPDDDATVVTLTEDPPHSSPKSSIGDEQHNKSNRIQEESDSDKDAKKEEGTEHVILEDGTDSNEPLLIDANPKTPSVDKETATVKASKTEEEQSESSNSQEKTLKKPDKILPCPRCNSMETKFCYYNNYNVNQPRHFCKKCQRYWTAGGTMRNVPVGAGRRKNKNSVTQYRQISVSEALQSARLDLPNGPNYPAPAVNTNGTVLAFGSDSPLCESMSSVLKIAEKTMQNKPDVLKRPGCNGEDHSSGSSITVANSKDDGASRDALNEPEPLNIPNYPPQVQFFPPWPYPWNPAQWNSTSPMPTFCPPPGFTMPFYPPSPYWGCTVPGSWNVRWIAPPPNGGSPTSGPTSPTLGKHSRIEEEEQQKENNPEKCLWFPKTLRIDDPNEAAKSSILATLGIQDDKDESFGRGGSLFKAFRSKGDEKNHIADTRPALHANPAALSRSLNFQESS